MLTMQDALARLTAYWTDQGCLVVQPMNTEVGAGTLNPATFLRVLGPEPWRVVYVEPSVRPDDSRYGENPNRLQTHTQLQVILKPDPGNPQELYLGSLSALGIDVTAHDVRFVEDNWASPALGAWGLGWEVWLDGLEITQFTYFQQAGGLNLDPPSVEITYGIERIIMALQGVTHFKDIEYATGVSYGEVFGQAEYEMSRYYLDDADVATNRQLLELYAAEAQRLIDEGLPVPAHTYVLKCSQAFNVLDSRGAVSTADRAAEFARMRRLAGDVARLWVAKRDELGHPLGVVEPLPAAQAAPSRRPRGTAPRTLVFEVGTEEMPPSEARAARAQLMRELDRAARRHPAGPRRRPGGRHAAPADRRGHRGGRPRGRPRAPGQGPEDHRGVRGGRHAQQGAAGIRPLARACRWTRCAPTTPPCSWRSSRPAGPRPAVLADALAKVVGALRSAKNMRWNDPQLAFTRPIRWLLALLGRRRGAGGGVHAGRRPRDPGAARRRRAGRRDRVGRDASWRRIAVNGIVADAAGPRGPDRHRRAGPGLPGRPGRRGRRARPDRAGHLPGRGADAAARHVRRELPVAAGRGADHGDAQAPALPAGPRRGRRAAADVRRRGQRRGGRRAVRAGNEAVLRARYEDAAFFYRADRQTPLPGDARPADPADLHRQAGLDGRPGGPDRRPGRGRWPRPTVAHPGTGRRSWSSSTSARSWSPR